MTLSAQTQKMTEEFILSQPEDNQAVIKQAFASLMSSNAGVHALNEGDLATDFSLPNANGVQTGLYELLQQGPVVLSFYRGGWCPYCNLEFKALHDILPQIRAMGANLVGVSPELPDTSLDTIARHKLQFEVLSDVGNQIARKYGIVMEVPVEMQPLYQQWGFDLPVFNGDETWELPIPATYVISKNGRIVSATVDKNYTQRMEPEAIVNALQSLID